MNDLLEQLAVEKAATLALQTSYHDEKLLRLKAEGSLQELRRIHESLACSSEISEEFIVNKVNLSTEFEYQRRLKPIIPNKTNHAP